MANRDKIPISVLFKEKAAFGYRAGQTDVPPKEPKHY